jgi:hypothetical protein
LPPLWKIAKRMQFQALRRKHSAGGCAAERHAIDRSNSLSARTDAAMSATDDFKKIPAWVKTAVDTNDRFKKLNVRRSSRAGCGLGDYNQWAYE